MQDNRTTKQNHFKPRTRKPTGHDALLAQAKAEGKAIRIAFLGDHNAGTPADLLDYDKFTITIRTAAPLSKKRTVFKHAIKYIEFEEA